MRRFDPFDRRSWVGSVAIHAVAVGVVVYATAPTAPLPRFTTYQIELVSPPPARQTPEPEAAQAKLVVERPNPAPPAEAKEAPVVKPVPKKPTPKPTASKETSTSTTVKEPGKEKRSAGAPDAKKSSSKEGGEGINVRLEGLRRDYPQYYANIILQIDRCFRPPTDAGKLVATIYFVIDHDGSVSDLSIAKKSGDPAFDYLAMGAVECAGKGRFGPLPKDVPYDRLPVQFTFTPAGSGGGSPPAPQNEREQVTSR
jgi:outer membrane biosynthesis protein TonB